MLFNEIKLNPETQKAIKEIGYVNATEIQAKSIPAILEGRDVIGLSSTGTGKTAAFGIPAIEIASANKGKSTVLILSPTRELALQISEEIRKFSKYTQGISVAVLYGGASMQVQINQLKNAQIVIGTPGRIKDHLQRKTLRLNKLHTIILDEADEMLNMGFIADINTILDSAPETRQTLLFSATMPPSIKKITEDYQVDPVTITVSSGQKTAQTIVQAYYNIPQSAKKDTLKLLLEYHKPSRALVFCNTKKMVDELSEELCGSGFKAIAIHGDIRQSVRTKVMEQFKNGLSTILVATDVAARGIDVDNMEAVFNYDLPNDPEYYIHRIGRTGRAGKAGASYTLIGKRDQLIKLREIERYIKAPIAEQPVPTLKYIFEKEQNNLINEIKEIVNSGAGETFVPLIEELNSQGISPIAIAAALYSKLHNENSRLKSVKNVVSVTAGKTNGTNRAVFEKEDKLWLRASIGTNAQITPNAVVAAILDATNLSKADIGRINIGADYTETAILAKDAEFILKSMQGVKINNTPVSYSIEENATVFSQTKTSSAHRAAFDKSDKLWLRASIGSTARITPNAIVAAILDATNLNKADIGRINICPDFTETAVLAKDAEFILQAMQGVKINGTAVEYSIVDRETPNNQRRRPAGSSFENERRSAPKKPRTESSPFKKKPRVDSSDAKKKMKNFMSKQNPFFTDAPKKRSK